MTLPCRAPRTWLLALALTALACGGDKGDKAEKPAKAEGQGAEPAPGGARTEPGAGVATTPPGKSPGAAAASGNLQQRVGDSLTRTLDPAKSQLPSYHVELKGDQPSLDRQTKKVVNEPFTLSADVAGQNVHLTQDAAKGGATKKVEGYIIEGGIGNEEKGGKEFEVVDGKVKPGMGVSLVWAMLPLQLVFPLSIGAAGAAAAGEEAIDGRPAEKVELDSAKAPPGVVEALAGMFTVTSAKGTAWLDKETGALLKMSLDYEQNFIDPPGSKTVVGKGRGHVEMEVTRVGKVTVTAPTP